jgi:hypothetical protein
MANGDGIGPAFAASFIATATGSIPKYVPRQSASLRFHRRVRCRAATNLKTTQQRNLNHNGQEYERTFKSRPQEWDASVRASG